MTTKEKYELIDKTKVSAKVLEILEKMEKASSNFTNAEVNSRVDTALDKIIEGLKVNKPDALLSVSDAKKEVKKEKKEAEEKNKGKDLSKKKDTDDKTGLPKKDTVDERKDIIKKESESEKEARERAKKELEKENEKAKDVIESQIEKLNRIILEDPALRGFNTGTSATGGGKSTPLIDAERKAIARGRRVSQKGRKNQYGASAGGRVYWENRENRSDRKSPDYPTGKPYLEKGGNVYASEDLYEVKMVQDGVELDSKLIRARNKGEARMIFEDMYQEKYQDEFGAFDLEIDIAKDRMADGGGIPYKPYGKTKGRFTLNYEDDGEQQSEIWSSLEEATNSARRYVNPKLGYTNVHIYDESGKEYFFADGGFMADGRVVNTRQLNKKIKDWYTKTYPTDEEGKEIDDKITFKAFYGYLWQGYNVYDVLEVTDSLIRERVFEKLSEILGVDYDVVYKKWLQSGEYDKGGMMADGGETDGELYIAYENTFKRFDSDVPVPMEDFEKLLHAYQKQLSGDKLDVVKYEVLKGQMGNYLGHKTVEEMEAYFVQRRNSYKMAHGGGVPYKPYGKTKGRFTLKYEDDGEQQIEIWSSLEEATNSARRYVNPKLGYTNVQIYDESGKEYFFADGGMMADGGVIGNGKNGYVAFYKGKKIEVYADTMYGAQKIASKHFKAKNEWEVNVVLAEVDGKPYFKSTAFANGGMMADGGEVDFDERMAKMRNAYDNLEMRIKGKIAMAIGIDNAISIMAYDYVVDPIDLIKGAVRSGLLELDEINADLVGSAIQEAERIDEDYKDSGQGIGSSDMTYFTKYVLDGAGYKTGFINNRLTRVDADGNELVINKYEMNF